MGIAPQEIGRIFEEFYQLDNPARDRSKGLGLGLAIVKRLAALLGHKVEAKSALGKGSVFAILVPRTGRLTEREVPTRTATIKVFLDGLSVLLIEDDAAVANAMHLLFTQAGSRIHTAKTGEEALTLLAQLDAPPDLLISDYRLPGGSTGIDVILELRKAVGATLPALILTGDTSAELEENATGLGCRVLHKPIASDALFSEIQDLLRNGPVKKQG